jgi:hypothetical protein
MSLLLQTGFFARSRVKLSDVRVRNQNIQHHTVQVVARSDKLTKRAAGQWKMIEVVNHPLMSAWMRSCHCGISFFSNLTTITALHVAPTAPCSIEYVSSWIEAESFHKQVGVVCVISNIPAASF